MRLDILVMITFENHCL